MKIWCDLSSLTAVLPKMDLPRLHSWSNSAQVISQGFKHMALNCLTLPFIVQVWIRKNVAGEQPIGNLLNFSELYALFYVH